MGFRKRSSKVLETVQTRASNLASIDPNLSLGAELTLAKFKERIDNLRNKLDAYNQTLSLADQQANEVDAAEKECTEYNRRMLSGIAAVHGPDSNEYEMAGGTRTSERKRPTRTKKS
ncbi:MAG: hypothetical protein WBP93_01865 [Pyrinomonadaceae bacterium]